MNRPGCARRALVLLSVLFLAYGGYRVWLEWAIAGERKALAERGFIASYRELSILYETPENATGSAKLYHEACQAYVDCGECLHIPVIGTGPEPACIESLPPNSLIAIEAFLEQNAVVLALLKEAATLPSRPYPRGEYLVDFSHLNGARTLQRLLAIDLTYAFETGDAERATEAIEASLALSASLGMAPMVTDFLSGIGIESIILYKLALSLCHVEFTPEQWERMDKRLQEAEAAFNPGFAFAAETGFLEGARSSAAECGETLIDGTVGVFGLARELPMVRTAVGTLYMLSGLHRYNVLRSARASRRIAVCYEEKPSLRALLAEVPPPPWDPVARPDFAYWSGVIAFSFDRLAQLRLARLALAVEQYRTQEGTLPKTLNDLVPRYLEGLPEHPLQGGAMQYATAGDDYAVYAAPQGDILDAEQLLSEDAGSDPGGIIVRRKRE